jgi:hypothetical protein
MLKEKPKYIFILHPRYDKKVREMVKKYAIRYTEPTSKVSETTTQATKDEMDEENVS